MKHDKTGPWSLHQLKGEMPDDTFEEGRKKPSLKWVKDSNGCDWPNPFYTGEQDYITFTLQQEVPLGLGAMIEESSGRITGLVMNDRDEFVDVSFDNVQDGHVFERMLRQEGQNARVFSHFDPRRSTVRIFA